VKETTMNITRLVTLVSLAILVGTEVAAAAVATAWALGGLFELGATITYGMMAVLLALGAYIMLRFVQNAIDVEPLHD
jgi:hypothetical protein